MPNDSQFTDPWATSRDTGQTIGVTALDARFDFGGLLTPANTAGLTYRTGIFPSFMVQDAQSNWVIGDGRVSPGAGLNVLIGPCNYVTSRGALGPFLGSVLQQVSAPIEVADPSNPRIDYVCLRTKEPVTDGTPTKSAWIVVHKGSAASNPTETVAAGKVESGDHLLAAVIVRPNANVIAAADVLDRRRYVSARGGIRVKSAYDNLDGSYDGEMRWNPAIQASEVWTAGEWLTLSSASPWVSFTPQLWSTAGLCSLGTAGKAQGAYQIMGKTMRVRYYFEAKRPCDLGYGSIYTKLPAGKFAAADGISDHHGRAQLNTQPPGGEYLSWIGDSGVYSGDNKVYPSFNKTRTDNTIAAYRVAADSQRAGGSGIPQLAGEFPDPLRGLGIHLELEIQ